MKNRHDQMEKELSEIRQAQVNLALYKTSSRSQIEDGTKEELQRLKKIIEDQRVALAQQSRASAGSSQLPPTSARSIEEKLEEIASIVKLFKEDLATFKERHKQLAELECYDVWAHQQANPNLVSMPLHDITKMVYNNLEAKKPMFLGALKTDPNPGYVYRSYSIPEEDLYLYYNQQVAFFGQFHESNPQVE
ncbi:hypothetical protein PIB30_107947 [Stylosanthes scabra]|uniref:Uncharacterized protein n=1 Tax=Stylosanthes scabra TaxID=79078 RepID=A0ABU6RZ54_9FABA|nr:hypothetical protein [Stylosanthes scabra]